MALYEENPVETLTNPNRVTVQPENTVQPYSQQMLAEIFANAAPPPPVYNEALQKRREKVAKLNAAGRGIAVLGDILSLSTGANVKQRPPDQVTPAMLQSYQGYIQQHDDRMDRFNYQTYRDNLMNKRLLYQDATRKEDIQREEQRYQDSQDWRDRQAALQEQRYLESQPWRQEGFKSEQDYIDYMRGKRELQSKYDKSLIDYRNGLTTDRLKSPDGESGYAHTIRLSDGTQKDLTKAEYSYLRDEAMKNAGLLAKQYPHLFEVQEEEIFNPETGQMEKSATGYQLSKTAKDDDLIRAYLELMDRYENFKIPGNWQAPQQNARPEYKGPVREGETPVQQAPAQQPQFDLSTKQGRIDAYTRLKGMGYSDEEIQTAIQQELQN